MKNNLLFILIAILVALLLWLGCAVYVPQTVSIPLMTQKNELHLNGGVDVYLGMHGDVDYSPAQNFAIQAHYYNCLGVLYYSQFALGTYLGNPKRVVGEVYGGIGLGGYTEADENNENTLYRSDYEIYYLQANIGQTNIGSVHLDYGGSLKLGMLKGDIWDYDNNNWLRKKSERVLAEPQVFFRLGSENLKIGFQVNAAWAYGPSEDYLRSVFIMPANAGITLQYRILPKKKEQF